MATIAMSHKGYALSGAGGNERENEIKLKTENQKKLEKIEKLVSRPSI